MPKLTCEGAILHYDQEGSGPDIVWIPGGDNIGADWVDQVSAFQDFRNTTFDPRGAGQTRALAPPPWTIPQYAADCAALIRAVCKPPVFLVGLSMGAKIVQCMAIEHPALIRCAIPMGTAPHARGFLKEWEDAEIAFRRAGGTLPEALAVAHYAVLMYPPEVLGDAAMWAKVRPFIAGSYGERDGEELAAQWQAVMDYDTLPLLPGCKVPMHVVAFSHDMQTPPAHGRRVAELAGNGHFHLLEGLAHLSLRAHKPEVVNACIRGIIERYL